MRETNATAKVVVVTAAYGNDYVKQVGGQQTLLAMIAAAGADGVEIRRELLSTEDITSLPALGAAIAAQGLTAYYSAPEPLFMQDNQLNARLPALLQEAQQLNAHWLKLSLGHYADSESFAMLRQWLLASPVALVVENDQTIPCGTIAPMQQFLHAARDTSLPVGMTFDMGNWCWVGEAPQQAAQLLAPFVRYIHVKPVASHNGNWCAIAPADSDNAWRELLALLPGDVPRGIEFPLQGADLTAVTRHNINLLREE